MTFPRSRLWWMKTRRIMRAPAGDCPEAAVVVDPDETFRILTEAGDPILAETGDNLRTE